MYRLFTRARWGVGLVALLVAALALIGPSPASAAGCDTAWGSLPESAAATSVGTIDNVRSGRHDCYDRLVVDVDDGRTGYTVRYVDELVEDGRGNVVPVRGGATLEIRVHSPAYDDAGQPTYLPADTSEAVNVGGYDTFRQVVFIGSFEGDTQIGLGVRARLPFRAFVLDGPGDGSRLVVDVAHRWPSASAPTSTVDVYYSTGDGSDCGEVSAFPRTAARTLGVARLALDQLVAGPTAAEEALGASSFFAASTADAVRSINLRNGLLTVDFRDIRSELANASTSCGSEALLAQLNSTVFQFPTIQRVRYQINGSCDDFGEWLQRECTEYEVSSLR
jgi:hypothetical protein